MAQHTSGDVVTDVLRAHSLCMLNQVMLRNPLYMEPQMLLKELAERP